MDWISVDDRLPEKGVKVLVYRPDAQWSHDPLFTIDMRTEGSHEDPRGVPHEFERWCRPSHWRPLPEPPT